MGKVIQYCYEAFYFRPEGKQWVNRGFFRDTVEEALSDCRRDKDYLERLVMNVMTDNADILIYDNEGKISFIRVDPLAQFDENNLEIKMLTFVWNNEEDYERCILPAEYTEEVVNL